MANHKRQNNHRHSRRPKHSFWNEYRFEIIVVFLLTTGIFLLVEKMEIKVTVYRWVRTFIIVSANAISDTAQSIFQLFHEVETSDIIGIILIIIALFMIYLRVRKRTIFRYATLYECPNCSGDLRRIHRKLRHRILGLLLWTEVKHFSCKTCDFHGIRMSER